MDKWLIRTILVIVAAGLGIGAAWGTASVLQFRTLRFSQASILEERLSSGNRNFDDFGGGAWMGGKNKMRGYPGNRDDKDLPGGMMGGSYQNRHGWDKTPRNQSSGDHSSGERISVDQAVTNVESYLKNFIRSDSDLEIKEVMEFTDNYYTQVVEKNTGKGAFELLVDPNSGAVFPEHGPNMMWNLKYGHMHRMSQTDSS